MVKRLKLNEKTVREAANLGRDYQIFDTDVRGFSVTIYPSGNRAFTLDYRVAGRQRPMPVQRCIGTVKANYKQGCWSTGNFSERGVCTHYRRTSALGRSCRSIFQLMVKSLAVFPAANASTNHCGLRPRPDQVSAGLSGCRYFAATGAREDFVSAPTSSAKE